MPFHVGIRKPGLHRQRTNLLQGATQGILAGIIICTMTNCNQGNTGSSQATGWEWSELRSIPDSIGFAGSFTGVSEGALMVAGGANFPNGGTPWNGGTKKWYDHIYVLDTNASEWKMAGKLPIPLGYGVSVTTSDGWLLMGGSNEEGHSNKVWRLRFHNGYVVYDSMPSLPFPLANACGALVDQTVYIAGGLKTPDDKETSSVFLSLNLADISSGWRSLPAWPGPSRMLSVAAAANHSFFLFSGAQLVNGQRLYLKDAYRYQPGRGWSQLAEMPHATVAAPSPGWVGNSRAIYLFGGDDGQLAARSSELRERHPGFSSDILSYSPDQDSWSIAAPIPTRIEKDAVAVPNNSVWAPVTTGMAVWNNQLVFPGGEVRPGTRTPRVLLARPIDSTNTSK